jgi:hypothetical protein
VYGGEYRNFFGLWIDGESVEDGDRKERLSPNGRNDELGVATAVDDDADDLDVGRGGVEEVMLACRREEKKLRSV